MYEDNDNDKLNYTPLGPGCMTALILAVAIAVGFILFNIFLSQC